MKYLLWVLAGFFSLFLVASGIAGLYTLGQIGLLVFYPIICLFDYLLLKKLGVIDLLLKKLGVIDLLLKKLRLLK